MGWRYTLYRLCHEIEKRVGILVKRHPIQPERKTFISCDGWRKYPIEFVIPVREKINFIKSPYNQLKSDAENILSGKIKFFSCEWRNIGLDYDWITNPDSGFQYNNKQHWSKIPDLSEEAGDIKYVWEKSRFSWVLTIIRYDYHFEEDHSDFVFSQIENWIDSNPINQGPNWRCSQEISLRIFNWCYVLHFYKNSEALSASRWKKIQNTIYWSLHHVYKHIDFSRIAVRNNHAITETLFLTLSNILFPFIPETKKWAKAGRKWFEQEIEYQIYNDGTFLQFSMNYHRVVIQLLSFGISITDKTSQPFSTEVKNKAYKSVNFLYQCMQEDKGYLPNYGANDGAWFFPLSDTDYRDYRPQLNALHKLLTGKFLFSSSIMKEECLWLGIDDKIQIHKNFPPIKRIYGIIEFKIGGYYLIREKESFTFIKCGKYNNRPSQADNLHVDIWHKGENILCDGGSYKYNTQKNIKKYFSGTESHNTVMLDNYDQMLKGARFIWLYWSQAIESDIKETENEYIFNGKIKCFSYIDKNIMHIRSVNKVKNKPTWIIKDKILHKPPNMEIRQLWHTGSNEVIFSVENNFVTKKAWQSLYYGKKEEIKQIECKTISETIETKISI